VTSILGPARRYLSQIPFPIRLLSLGVLINRVGGYVTVYLTLILGVRHISADRISLALALSAIFAIAGSGCGGFLAVRIGGRLTIFISMIGSALFTTLLVFPGPFVITVTLICCIALFNRAYIPPAATIIGRSSPPGQRVKMYAFYQFAFNVGAAVGPVIVTYLVTRSLTALFLIDASTSGLFALAALRLPAATDSRPPARQRRNYRWLLQKDRRYILFCLSVVITALVYAQSSGALPLIFTDRHYSLQLLGVLLSANAVSVILFQLPVSSVTKRLPPWLPIAAGGFLICGSYGILLGGFSLPLLIINVSGRTLGEMLVNPVRPVVAMTMSTEDSHGVYQGALSLAQTAGQVIGPSAGVFAYSFGPSLPWVAAWVLLVPATVLPVTLLRDIPSHPDSPRPQRPGQSPDQVSR
jgi:MFS family permease